MEYWQIFSESFGNYWNYLVKEVTLAQPKLENYFYYLVAASVFVWLLELAMPWRKKQAIFRKQFWMDGFYMFFNFFIFNLVIFIALSNTMSMAMNDFWGLFGIAVGDLQLVYLDAWPKWAALGLFFIVSDFVQWATHIMLHRVPFFWKIHKIHHSVEQMGFAAHLRYHWGETIIYRSMLYIPLALIGGFNVADVFIVHYISILVGHLNHANIPLDYGPLKYILNNPKMHIWHHAKDLPPDRKYGVNFGITFSFWDYLFGTSYIPHEGRDIELGFDHVEEFPQTFMGHMAYPFVKDRIK
jgi:sterol desaturase/sphingolipid hydroxylase (fatty acid hydroxylase superfamily)